MQKVKENKSKVGRGDGKRNKMNNQVRPWHSETLKGKPVETGDSGPVGGRGEVAQRWKVGEREGQRVGNQK